MQNINIKGLRGHRSKIRLTRIILIGATVVLVGIPNFVIVKTTTLSMFVSLDCCNIINTPDFIKCWNIGYETDFLELDVIACVNNVILIGHTVSFGFRAIAPLIIKLKEDIILESWTVIGRTDWK